MGTDQGPRPEPCPNCGCTRQHWKPKKRDFPVPALRKYRIDRGWTLERLANNAQVSKNTVWAIENGYQNARLSTAKLLADALGLPLESLIDPNKPRITPTKVQLRGTKLRGIRVARGYSLCELSRRSGVSRNGIRGIELGGYTQTTTLQKLATALELPMEDLV